MANTATRTDSYRFSVDQQAIWHAEREALAFARETSSAFFSRLVTPIGEYEISVGDVGIALARVGVSPFMFRWSRIDAWAVDKNVFMARDTTGNTVILPRAGLPEDIFEMTVDICNSMLKGAQLTTSGNYRKWRTSVRIKRLRAG